MVSTSVSGDRWSLIILHDFTGFAFGDTLKNFVAGFIILFLHPFKACPCQSFPQACSRAASACLIQYRIEIFTQSIKPFLAPDHFQDIALPGRRPHQRHGPRGHSGAGEVPAAACTAIGPAVSAGRRPSGQAAAPADLPLPHVRAVLEQRMHPHPQQHPHQLHQHWCPARPTRRAGLRAVKWGT